MAKVSIKETAKLPSRGLIYGFKVPEEFPLRAMTTMEEKLRLSSNNSMEVLPEIINRCADNKIDAYKLSLIDLQYLMFKLRIITYGPDYSVDVICPTCGKRHKLVLDLDSIETKYINDDASEYFEVGPLPMSKDIILCKYLTAEDYDNISKDSKKMLNKYPNYEGDPSLIIRYEYAIKSINGEDVTQDEIKEYIETLHARDFMVLESECDRHDDSYGLDLSMIETCNSCGEDIKFNIPINSEFFRPRY